MRKTIVTTLIVFFALILLPIGAQAAIYKTGSSVYVGKDLIVPDNLYAAGNTVTIDGTVKGDLICAGGSIIVNGKVEGDVIGAG
ncbi:MAG: hypothetical protein NTW06_01975, partial [Candidatus Falkowbacteria bacterium]|nr:hypothetical protein [Candidatus Falkowbacteria bacterium]